jgi:uncharacterized phiE125 gp8 family phage protein
MALRLITPPAGLPVTLDEAKAHLRVDSTDEDLLITALIQAATSHVQHFLGRALIDQTWELVIDRFPHYHYHRRMEVMLPLPPLIKVVSITYDDPSGVAQVLPESGYTVDDVSEPGWVVPAGMWPATFHGINAVRVRYRAGYLDNNSPPAASVPPDITAAIRLYVGTLFEHRETEAVGAIVTQMPWAAEQLLRQHRIELSMS